MFRTGTTDHLGDMGFVHLLAAARKQRGLIQHDLAERVGICVSQICRYEAGDSALLFNEAERGPGSDSRRQVEATACLGTERKGLVQAPLDAVLLRQDARRFTAAS